MGMLLHRGRDEGRPTPARKPQFLRYEEHTRIVQELTNRYEREILELKASASEDKPSPKRAKPGRPRKAKPLSE